VALALESSSAESADYKREKNRLKLVKSFRLGGRWDLAGKVQECGSRFLGFFAPTCRHRCGRALRFSCGVRFCPYCEKDRGAREFEIIQALFEEMEDPRFITLTVPNVEKMEDQIDSLRECLTRLRHQKRFKGYVSGGRYALEVTNKGKGWHPHVHALVDGKYYPQAELSEDWKLAGGGPVVWIQKADLKGVMELSWYMVKGSQFFDCPEKVTELFEAIKGKRMSGSFGWCYNRYNELKKEQKKDREPMTCPHGEELEWAGTLKLSDVYLDAEKKEWRIYRESLLLLQMQYFERVKRAA